MISFPVKFVCSYLKEISHKQQIFVTFFVTLKLKKALQISVTPFSAEREGFEPPDPLRSTVFKTAAFDHSAISPVVVLKLNFLSLKTCSFQKGLQRYE